MLRVHCKRCLLPVLLSLVFTVTFLPGNSMATEGGGKSLVFREAGISITHPESMSFLTGRAGSGGDDYLAILGAKEYGCVAVGSVDVYTLTRPEDLEEEIESNMKEEEVAEAPEDMYEDDIVLPVDLNRRVEFAIRYIQKSARDRFEVWMRRSGKYDALMRNILKSESVPGDFTYLAMIESGFSTKAVSRAGAVGIWQFMYWTGKKYGLDINWWVDERMDFERSTRAAGEYLKELYDMFGSWYLAAAAYNVGEGKIDRAIRRFRTRDYWKLVSYRYLPRETKNYVPKMLAAITIVKEPEKYGITDVTPFKPISFDVVDLPGGIDLRKVSELVGVDFNMLEELNPAIRRGITPLYVETYPIRFPEGLNIRVLDKLADIIEEGQVKLVLHRVRGRDSIYRLSRKYKSDVKRIKQINGLRANSIRGRRWLMIPVIGEPNPYATAALKRVDSKMLERVVRGLERSARYYYVYRQGNRTVYLVKRGDSLYSISMRFHVPISRLKRMNGLNNNIIRPGQKLVIRVYNGRIAGKSRKVYSYKVQGGKKYYTIQEGDSLYEIAKRFKLSLKILKSMNAISSDILLPGKQLVVGFAG